MHYPLHLLKHGSMIPALFKKQVDNQLTCYQEEERYFTEAFRLSF